MTVAELIETCHVCAMPEPEHAPGCYRGPGTPLQVARAAVLLAVHLAWMTLAERLRGKI